MAAISFGIFQSMQATPSQECPLEDLRKIISMKGYTNPVYSFFEMVNGTIGLNCQNYLLRDGVVGGTGYIDQIRPEWLSEPVMWGIDRETHLAEYIGRPYIALKFICNSGKEAAASVFKRHLDQWSDWGDLAIGGHFSNSTCFLPVSRLKEPCLGIFRELFQTGNASFIGRTDCSSAMLASRLIQLASG